jgi:hypothetical protein
MSNDNDLHPVRFTNKQVEMIAHIMDFAAEHYEEETQEFFDIVEKYENKEETDVV